MGRIRKTFPKISEIERVVKDTKNPAVLKDAGERLYWYDVYIRGVERNDPHHRYALSFVAHDELEATMVAAGKRPSLTSGNDSLSIIYGFNPKLWGPRERI